MTIIAMANLQKHNVLLADTIVSNPDSSTYTTDKISNFLGKRFFTFAGNGVLHEACKHLITWSLYRGYDLTLHSEIEIQYLIKIAMIYEDLLEISHGSKGRSEIKSTTIFVVDKEKTFYWDLALDIFNNSWKLISSSPAEIGVGQYHVNFFGSIVNTKDCPESFTEKNLISTVENSIDIHGANKALPYVPSKSFTVVKINKENDLSVIPSSYSLIPYECFTDYLLDHAISMTNNGDVLLKLTEYKKNNKWSPF